MRLSFYFSILGGSVDYFKISFLGGISLKQILKDRSILQKCRTNLHLFFQSEVYWGQYLSNTRGLRTQLNTKLPKKLAVASKSCDFQRRADCES